MIGRIAGGIFWLLALAVAQADWQSELTPSKGSFAPLRSFHAHYKFGWGFVSAAEAELDFARGKAGLGKANLQAKSTGAVRLTWRMDATHTATMHTATLRPIETRQKEIYSDETIKTRVTFTDAGVTRLRESDPPAKNPAKEKTFEFPLMYDLHSAFHFVRSQRLQTGDVYKFVVYPSARPYLAEVKVAGRDRTQALGKSSPAIKIDLRLWEINKDHTLASVERYKRASAWLSDDADRILLRIESEIFVGRVWMELESVTFR